VKIEHGVRKSVEAVGLVFLLGALGILAYSRAQAPVAPELPGLDKLPAIKELPDPFLMNNGRRAATRKDWARRREELKAKLLHYEYGHLAPAPSNLAATEVSSKQLAEIAATERQILLTMGPGSQVSFQLTLTIPAGEGPFPVIIKGDLCWGRVAAAIVESAIRRGYIVAEFDRTQIAPDNADRTKGVHPLYPDHDWSTLAAWAWGFHRVTDYLLTQKNVNPKRIAITGHSRGGKAALLAGALDERISLTAPNGSGCGGAGCYRVLGDKCEDIEAITKRFPYWFHPRFKEFVGHVDQIPFDQHSLKALVAPRAQLSTEALGDLWANPLGTQVSFLAAREVYRFLGVADKIGIHYRQGKHEQNVEDWGALLDFADLQFLARKVDTKFDRLPFSDAPKAFTWSAPKAIK
jgi:hypothetical protein